MHASSQLESEHIKKHHFLLVLLVFFCLGATGQTSSTQYVRAKVILSAEQTPLLHRAGLDLEHGMYLPNRLYIGDLATWELDRLESLGLEYEVLIPDVVAHYKSQQPQRQQLICQQFDHDYALPQNFDFGSMGGYLTYQEMIDMLDAMANQFPGLISVRAPVGTEQTHQGRELQWVRISDNPDVDEDEPEILYTALHHAREPMSMMQMMYYMWYILENYSGNSEIKYLVDNTEMYFIPCVNPDGYIYNHSIEPDGGGLWRKNMRDNNGDDVFLEKDDGVDLNRNYAFQWGLDDEGSSSHPGSNVYRGEAAFSEPETRAVRDFISDHDFLFALNYHAYGNFLLIPWGFNGVHNPDSIAFVNYGELMAIENGYEIGTTEETLGYLTNGVASDWMYASHDIVAITPELGDEEVGFWPPQNSIIPLCEASLKKNLFLAHLTHRFALATNIDKDFFTSREGDLSVMIKRYGLESGSMALSVESLSPELQIQGALHEIGFDLFEKEYYTYQYSLGPDAISGEEYQFVVKVDNGFFEVRDTVSKIYIEEEIAFVDDGATMDHWVVASESTWGVTDEEAISGTTSLTDSPGGLYAKGQINEMTIQDPIDLHDALDAELQFSAKWAIEEIIDYALVQISTDGVNFHNLCGQYSEPGSIFQLTGEPLYHGIQPEWVRESIDLSSYVGEDVYIRFAMVSDGFFEMDGIYIDDVEIKVYTEESTSVLPLPADQFGFRQFPNPAQHAFQVDLDLSDLVFDQAQLHIYDPLGRKISSRTIQPGQSHTRFATASWPSGIYTTSLVIDGASYAGQRIVITR